MKKIIFKVQTTLVVCCLFLAATFSLNAQNLSLGTTNALSMSGPTVISGVHTYNIVIPYYETSLTGTFKLSYGTTSNPFTCSSPYFRYITLNTGTGGYVSNSSNLNTVSIPGTIAVGTSDYVMRVYCANSAPDLPSILRGTFYIKINVTKEVAPSVNLNFAPYCKVTPNTNPQQYNGYIGFNVTGNYANAGKLYLRVTNALGTCPYIDYKVTLLHNSGAATATISPTASFYDCATNTTYTIKLVYKGTTVSGNAIEQVVSTGQIGWNEYSWKKTFRNCLNVLEPVPVDPVFERNITGNVTVDLVETKKINVYPNPTNNDLNILPAEGKEIRSVKVLDPNGLVYESKAFRSAKGEQTISLAHLRPGIYFLEIETNEGIAVEKVIKN
ncbi:T9SS type A sorting domain-containing protein [Flavobacterium cerinum]|uniref:T9SS type A sorting domain-containing protein n=1 Tax=Flavobacterium cerinum TaxID=2502784 RepID=A0ABY5IWI6_9FLAO|nr:T9SS type A sorting domain-containing protein [Flavobacterium cerinum]UUC45872.1 T9SS type A sorting domain-containing protein [Flavobacterium cerinum]